jgi:hypothetical protein
MYQFDLYSFGDTESESFFIQPFQVGQTVWLDGVDGFFDQYFDSVDEAISFVAIRSGPASLPTDSMSFAQLPFIQATIRTNHSIRAEVEITSVQPLQAWMLTVPLPTVTLVNTLSALYRPAQTIIERLISSLPNSENALWTSSALFWSGRNDISAVYMVRTEHDVRCIILKSNDVPSVLLRLS